MKQNKRSKAFSLALLFKLSLFLRGGVSSVGARAVENMKNDYCGFLTFY